MQQSRACDADVGGLGGGDSCGSQQDAVARMQPIESAADGNMAPGPAVSAADGELVFGVAPCCPPELPLFTMIDSSAPKGFLKTIAYYRNFEALSSGTCMW